MTALPTDHDGMVTLIARTMREQGCIRRIQLDLGVAGMRPAGRVPAALEANFAFVVKFVVSTTPLQWVERSEFGGKKLWCGYEYRPHDVIPEIDVRILLDVKALHTFIQHGPALLPV